MNFCSDLCNLPYIKPKDIFGTAILKLTISIEPQKETMICQFLGIFVYVIYVFFILSVYVSSMRCCIHCADLICVHTAP